MNVLDLFSGIGGFSLGLERAGMRTVAFCEIEKYCRAVLTERWPGVPIYGDIREINADRLTADGISVDVICGGFPCQDISAAGKGAGLAGARSGLWREYHRLICELRPRYVIVENVSALLSRGLGTVLGDLATLGYDAEWHCIPAAYVGAPHRRDRVWIIAYPGRDSVRLEPGRRGGARGADTPQPAVDGTQRSVANADDGRLQVIGQSQHGELQGPPWDLIDGCGEGRPGHRTYAVRDADREYCEGRRAAELQGQERPQARYDDLGDADGPGSPQRPAGATPGAPGRDEWGESHAAGWWQFEPDVGRVAHGVPARVDRLKALGNAVVPQVVEIIGRAIQSLNAAEV